VTIATITLHMITVPDTVFLKLIIALYRLGKDITIHTHLFNTSTGFLEQLRFQLDSVVSQLMIVFCPCYADVAHASCQHDYFLVVATEWMDVMG